MTERGRCCDKCFDETAWLEMMRGLKSTLCKNPQCSCHSSDKDWESRLDLIWNRAHIPEYADDAKVVIIAFIKQLLSDREKAIGVDLLWEIDSANPSLRILREKVAKLINPTTTHGRD